MVTAKDLEDGKDKLLSKQRHGRRRHQTSGPCHNARHHRAPGMPALPSKKSYQKASGWQPSRVSSIASGQACEQPQLCEPLPPTPPHPHPEVPTYPHHRDWRRSLLAGTYAKSHQRPQAAILQANGLDTTYSIMATVKIDASPFSVDARIPAVPVPQPELQVLLHADLNVICLRINNNKNNRPTWTRCAGPCSTPSWFWAGKSWAGRARSTWAHSNTSA